MKKRICAFMMSIVVLVSTICIYPITVDAASPSWSSDWHEWQQCDWGINWKYYGEDEAKNAGFDEAGYYYYSFYDIDAHHYGCWVVAQAKMIAELGIDSYPNFNPEIYKNWEKNNGHLNSSFNQVKGGEAPVDYAKHKGFDLYYGGEEMGLAHLGQDGAKKEILRYLSDPSHDWRIIIHVTCPSSHYIYVDKEKSLANNKVYISDSSTSPSKYRFPNPDSSKNYTTASFDINLRSDYSVLSMFVYELNTKGHGTYDSSTHLCLCGCGAWDPNLQESVSYSKSVMIRATAGNAPGYGPYAVCADGSKFYNSGTELESTGHVKNLDGQKWYVIPYNGSNYYVNAGYFEEFIPEHDHTWIDKQITKAPTCTQTGEAQYTCSICKETKTETLPVISHDYRLYEYTKECESVTATFKCATCNDAYTEKDATIQTDWVSEKSAGISDDYLEQKTEYRKTVYETTTSNSTSELEGWHFDEKKYSAWSNWSDYGLSQISASDLVEVETAAVHRWYAYACPVCGTHDPYGGACSGCGYNLDEVTNQIVYWLTSDALSSATIHADSKKYMINDSSKGILYYAQNWDDETGYRSRTRTVTYNFSKVTGPTEWQTTPIEEDENTVVETRTLYRYTIEAGGHDFVENVTSENLASAANCTTPAQYYKSCSKCGEKSTETFSSGTADASNHIGGTYTLGAVAATDTEDGYTGDVYCSGCDAKLQTGTVIPKTNSDAVKIYGDAVKAKSGETVEIPLYIKNNPGITYLKIKIQHGDETQLVAVKNEGLIEGSFVKSKTLDVNPYVLQWTGADTSSEDGCFATASFTINENAEEGDYTIKLIFDSAFDEDYNEVLMSTENIKLTVKNYTYGDVNDDGIIDGRDAILLERYLADWDVTLNLDAADVTADGKIDGRDGVRLEQYLAEWDVTLGK